MSSLMTTTNEFDPIRQVRAELRIAGCSSLDWT